MNRVVRRWFVRYLLPACLLLCLLLAAVAPGGVRIARRDASSGLIGTDGECSEWRLTEQRLLMQVAQLERTIDELTKRLQRQADGSSNDSVNQPCTSNYMQKQVQNSELLHGKKWRSEYEIIPYSHLNFAKFFPGQCSLSKRPVERPLGARRRDLHDALKTAVSLLATGAVNGSTMIKAQNLIEALYRNDPVEGTHYEMWFEDPSRSDAWTKVSMLRPYAPLVAVDIRHARDAAASAAAVINIVVPLSGRFASFQAFVDRFEKRILKRSEERVELTVVLFGGDSLWAGVQTEMRRLERSSRFSRFHVLNANGTFSRARALQLAAQHWGTETSSDVLLFFCDVDIAFDSHFLSRCRRQTEANRQAYFPIVFSLYNPKLTLNITNNTSKDDDDLIISSDTGFWRDFGYGMLCTYKSDFDKMGGFSGYQPTTWGGEDIYLYRKYLRSELRIVRAPDPHIFHLWHPKHCPHNLARAQLQACLRSRALSEASHDQLAMLYYQQQSKQLADQPQDQINEL